MDNRIHRAIRDAEWLLAPDDVITIRERSQEDG